MNVITNTSAYESIRKRILALNENSTRQWGRMTVHQMLLHCIDALKMTIGELQVADKSNFLTRTIVKKFALGKSKFPKSTPTAPELVKTEVETNAADIEKDKQILLAYIDKIKNASEKDFEVHPIFGKMNKIEYGTLIYKHLDHHLRQFGA